MASTLYENTQLTPIRFETLGSRVATEGDRPSIRVQAPVTEEEIGTVPACTAADTVAAVDRARTAQSAWAETAVESRAEIIERFGDLVVEHRDELLDIVQLETGKVRQHALEEVLDIPATCSYYASNGAAALTDSERAAPVPLLTSSSVSYDPVGVVGVISPWNYPLTLSVTDVIPALLAGNAVVCKPDERTPFIALALAELLAEAGLPDGLLQVVTGEGPVVGPPLVDNVDYLVFTGGTETGRTVAEQAGRNLIDCSLELGGKNPLVVLDDADVETAARGAVVGAFRNAGQLCLAPERIYVDETQYDAFLDAFVAATEDLTLGYSLDYGPDIGSLIDGAHLDSVRDAVDGAVDEGATVLTGGSARPDIGPNFYEPTVLTDVPPGARITCEETFGPVVTVVPVADTREAIERANDTEYGLNGSVWTADRDRGQEVAREIDCGTVCVNDAFAVGWAAVDAPMGGIGDSGLGRRHGPEGIRRFVESKTIATSRVGPLDTPPSVPHSISARLLTGLTALQRRLNRWLY